MEHIPVAARSVSPPKLNPTQVEIVTNDADFCCWHRADIE